MAACYGQAFHGWLAVDGIGMRHFRSATAERQCVARFGIAMRRKLRENRFKGGWRHEDLEFLLDKLQEEVDELRAAITCEPRLFRDIEDEAADVGNMAMMLADWAAHNE